MKNKEYEIEYSHQFEADIASHKKAGRKTILKKIDSLVDELRVHPTTGTGNPEPLKGNLLGKWSRRITKKHRLIYEIKENEVTVLIVSGYGHYDDK